MCGIFALLNNDDKIPANLIKSSFQKGQSRGPEDTQTKYFLQGMFGFHRLAINGFNYTGNQPMIIDDIILICNGEIYNYKELYDLMEVVPKTSSDCEVIIHLFKKYGIEQTLNMLDGEFSFILLDNRINDSLDNKIYVARDPYGVRPLYYIKQDLSINLSSINTVGSMSAFVNKQILCGFASELKCLVDIYNTNPIYIKINQFTPGTFSEFHLSSMVQSYWEPNFECRPYFVPNFSYIQLYSHVTDNVTYGTIIKDIANNITTYLNNAVIKRCLATERPVACLLSGGLDSSLVAALANNYYKMNDSTYQLETYSIGLSGSEDLKYARFVADYLGTNHTEIVVTEKEMFDAIPYVIYAIESYDTTTIRASIGNYLLGKYIRKNSKAKVILNGDGSDELFGGYIYMNKCPNSVEFDKETRRLLKDIYLFDVLRSDKSISSHGLEPRTPFLDRSLVNYYLSISPVLRNHNIEKKMEKFLLRNSFSSNYFQNVEGKQLLPNEILWRKKEAFSDGVTSKGRSLYQILQEHISVEMEFNEFNMQSNMQSNNLFKRNKYPPCIETEKIYYKQIFDSFYPNCESILPYFWMPKYIDAKDPSARTLEIYQEQDKRVQ